MMGAIKDATGMGGGNQVRPPGSHSLDS